MCFGRPSFPTHAVKDVQVFRPAHGLRFSQATSVEAIERFELLAASGVGIDVKGALQAALTDSLGPQRPQVLSAAVLPAATPVPAPSSSGLSSAPAPAAAKMRWATAAASPRYAAGARPADVALASAKAVGAPQLLTTPGLRCKSNLAIAWGPTMARPRMLQLTYSSAVPVSMLEGVVVAVVNIGTTAAPLQSIDLLVLPLGAATNSSLVVLNLYTHRVGDAKLACPALNTYALPTGLSTGTHASARGVGVRLRPSQDRVAGKGALLQVGVRRGRVLQYTHALVRLPEGL
jgi:hypothetical protein